MSRDVAHYGHLLDAIKVRIRRAQNRAVFAANAELIALYWDVGRMILERQNEEGWGAGVIPRLAGDLKNALPELKGFSERNIGYMVRFAREYAELSFLQQAVAKSLDQALKCLADFERYADSRVINFSSE